MERNGFRRPCLSATVNEKFEPKVFPVYVYNGTFVRYNKIVEMVADV